MWVVVVPYNEMVALEGIGAEGHNATIGVHSRAADGAHRGVVHVNGEGAVDGVGYCRIKNIDIDPVHIATESIGGCYADNIVSSNRIGDIDCVGGNKCGVEQRRVPSVGKTVACSVGKDGHIAA